ncbi:hypothetical protein QJ854_gp696 [Moumouvirus goulette]|uniref:Uncharacterized protein n=1 Tax=Moumouvirus goulette TaxID=1247379 RepID=M1PMB8_9VIRU|nr:hypothetical protein QJ854_gp696 [Moumouvirus goulette]AGF85086.1 hypothetical protein glt_00277 [Moumouvirus goulette]
MIRDPAYYLKKAKYFYNISKQKDNEENNDLDYLESESNDIYNNSYKLSSDNYEDTFEELNEESSEELSDNETEYEYIKLEPVDINELINEKLQDIAPIKPRYGRFYDPVSKHYFTIDKIFNNNGIRPNNKSTRVWYPENSLSYKYVRDPKTNKLYKTSKNYDDNGNYTQDLREVKRKNIRRPGTTYVVPVYKSK